MHSRGSRGPGCNDATMRERTKDFSAGDNWKPTPGSGGGRSCLHIRICSRGSRAPDLFPNSGTQNFLRRSAMADVKAHLSAPVPVRAATAWPRIALAAIVLVFSGLRVAAAANDLWIDELWTLWHVVQLRSIGEILSRFTVDNNHPLNSLWMYVALPLKTDWSYRLLSVLSGSAAIWLAAKVARLQWLR